MIKNEDLSVHVTFGTQTAIVNCPRTLFLSKVAECFEIEEDEIDIYDKKRGIVITVEDLRDVMKVEIKKKTSESPQPSTSRNCRYPDLADKLRDNRTLTGAERKFLVDYLKNYKTLRETQGNPRRNPIMKRNIKIQVNPERLISITSVATQTDDLINHVPNNPTKKRSLSANEVLCQSKRLASSSKSDPAKIKELMDKTYDERRSLILLRLPLVSFLKGQYPLLFSFSEVRNELDRIFFPGRSQQFLNNIEKYALAILSLARDDDPLLSRIRNTAHTLSTPSEKKYALEVGSILMLSSLLYEDRHYLKLQDEPHEITNLPCIEAEASFTEIYSAQLPFKTYVEGCKLCEAPNFKAAILSLMGAYYIFNIEYPDTNLNTFTAFDLLYIERSDVEELDDFMSQIIRTIQLKAEAWESSS